MLEQQRYHPVRSILVLAWPAVLEMCLHTVYWICDAAMVMRLGAREASAVEYAATILFGIINTCGALGIGVNSLVARFVGGKDHQSAGLVAGQAISASLAITSALLLVMGLFGRSFFLWAIKDGPTAALTAEYFYTTVFSGGIFIFLIMVINGAIRGLGNTRVPMFIALAANVFNIFFDYVLIFGKLGFPALGVKGAALATGTAQVLGLAIGVLYLYRRRRDLALSRLSFFPLQKPVLKGIFRISIPLGLEELVNNSARILSATWVAALGPISFAASAATLAAESFSFMPGYAFAIAATTLVGQRLGAGRADEAERTGILSTYMALIMMSAIALAFYFCSRQIMSIFDPPEAEVLSLGIACLRVAALEQPFIAVALTLAGALKGAGDTRGPLATMFIASFFIRLPLTYLVVYVFKLDVTFTWWVTVLQYLVAMLLMLRRYRRTRWEQLAHKPSFAPAEK